MAILWTYLITSDGQCEQAGYQIRTATTQEISFHIPYLELPDVWLQVQHTAASTDGRPPLLNGITTSSFVANIYTAYAGFYWHSLGYISF